MEALVSGHCRDSVSITGAGRLRECKNTEFAVADVGEGPAFPLFLDQTEIRGPPSPPLSQGLDDRAVSLSECLDPPLICMGVEENGVLP